MAKRYKVLGLADGQGEDFDWVGHAKSVEEAKTKAKLPDSYKNVRVYEEVKEWRRVSPPQPKK